MRILVVVDMQNDFIDGPLGTPQAQAVVGDVVRKINEFKGNMICLTKDTHTEEYLKTQEGGLLPVKHCIWDTEGWRVRDEIATAVSHKAIDDRVGVSVFHKDAFGSVELGNYLADFSIQKGRKIQEVVIVGLCTDICVISNALLIKAFLPETKITVDATCCAGTTPENHKNALAAMKVCQINVENMEG